MEDLSEVSLCWERIEALIVRDRIAHDLRCKKHDRREETAFWLALLGWTPAAFLIEAYPEYYGGGRG